MSHAFCSRIKCVDHIVFIISQLIPIKKHCINPDSEKHLVVWFLYGYNEKIIIIIIIIKKIYKAPLTDRSAFQARGPAMERLCQLHEAEYVKRRICRAHWTAGGCWNTQLKYKWLYKAFKSLKLNVFLKLPFWHLLSSCRQPFICFIEAVSIVMFLLFKCRV